SLYVVVNIHEKKLLFIADKRNGIGIFFGRFWDSMKNCRCYCLPFADCCCNLRYCVIGGASCLFSSLYCAYIIRLAGILLVINPYFHCHARVPSCRISFKRASAAAAAFAICACLL